MKTLISLLIFSLLSITAFGQKPVLFHCYKIDIGDIKADKVVSKTTDILIKVDAAKHTISIASMNAQTQKVDVSTRVFYKTSEKGESRSLYIKDDDGDGIMTIQFDKSEILYLDQTSNKMIKFYYKKIEYAED